MRNIKRTLLSIMLAMATFAGADIFAMEATISEAMITGLAGKVDDNGIQCFHSDLAPLIGQKISAITQKQIFTVVINNIIEALKPFGSGQGTRKVAREALKAEISDWVTNATLKAKILELAGTLGGVKWKDAELVEGSDFKSAESGPLFKKKQEAQEIMRGLLAKASLLDQDDIWKKSMGAWNQSLQGLLKDPHADELEYNALIEKLNGFIPCIEKVVKVNATTQQLDALLAALPQDVRDDFQTRITSLRQQLADAQQRADPASSELDLDTALTSARRLQDAVNEAVEQNRKEVAKQRYEEAKAALDKIMQAIKSMDQGLEEMYSNHTPEIDAHNRFMQGTDGIINTAQEILNACDKTSEVRAKAQEAMSVLNTLRPVLVEDEIYNHLVDQIDRHAARLRGLIARYNVTDDEYNEFLSSAQRLKEVISEEADLDVY